MKIAVVGAGISGLSAAWLLSRRHEVTLYEQEGRLGGHSNTVDVEIDGVSHPVDTGFIVFNRDTYPNLCGLFALLGVPIADSDMSFGVSLREPDIEWAGTNLASVFAQPANLARPRFWGMLQDILRFNSEVTERAANGSAEHISLGEFLVRHRYGDAFRDWYLLPMAAAIWSCPTQTMMSYPLATFARFCHNHGLLRVNDRPQWLTVRGGSREYVKRMAAALQDVRRAAAVKRLQRVADGVLVQAAGVLERYDQVVLACHSDEALALLGDTATASERRLLGAIRYQPNHAVLHTDTALLPRNRRVWSSWNYMAGVGAPDSRPVSVSYLMNRLQPLPFEQPVVVSLNPFIEPDPARVIARIDYAHPLFDGPAIDAQARLPEIQGRDRLWYCGAWTGYGFHEDGLASAVRVARHLGADIPWQRSGEVLAA
ncbi:NAD(P)/FAD-dependent oxidoreductase [Methyloversatilis discipulorum]|uniref:NAD(P)/FAD-dependent oxidoreductase n=1 Tax=Methyloversatilis discipulorum TaxID=1119528 RepID=UPI001A4FE034|nr:FAD-dependent oxidoreductase [Methyloversatilis discipulorum]MBL8468758.1 FAD-dependent oxidoreductase [Methyloversatilis discipulorum]